MKNWVQAARIKHALLHTIDMYSHIQRARDKADKIIDSPSECIRRICRTVMTQFLIISDMPPFIPPHSDSIFSPMTLMDS